MSPEKWPIARKRNIFSGWFEWESCSPGHTGDMPFWQKSRFPLKIDFLPKISKFSGQNCTFLSLANLSRTGQCFQHGKGVSLVPWYEYTKSFTFNPKNGIWAKKLPKLAQNWHFWPIWSNARPKNNAEKKLCRWDFVMWVSTLLLTYIEIRIFGKKTAKFGPKDLS